MVETRTILTTFRRLSAVKMRPQILGGNEATRLAINRLQGPGGERCMQWDRQCLPFTGLEDPTQLTVTASCSDYFESKPHEDCRDVAAGQFPKPQRHSPAIRR